MFFMIKKKITGRNLNKLARLLQVSGDKSRLRILCLIFEKKKICVSMVAREAGLSIANASHHLRVMANAGLLEPKKEGKEVCYFPAKSRLASDLKRFVCRHS
jgi:DNA-binding transcriptional ArsR family regulator